MKFVPFNRDEFSVNFAELSSNFLSIMQNFPRRFRHGNTSVFLSIYCNLIIFLIIIIISPKFLKEMRIRHHISFKWLALTELVCWCLCFSFHFKRAESSRVLLQTSNSSFVGGQDKQYRTLYHFQPPKNWINDPNGPMYYNGNYHLFYQYNPQGAVWGNIVWAHSVSTDLVNWLPLDIAISPTQPSDIQGCWSGSATILPGNQPVILYTGMNAQNQQVQNMAFPKNLSDPYLTEWDKPDYNPLMEPVDGIDGGFFRDPTTGWYGTDGYWRVAVGGEVARNGVAFLYKSKDFKNWTRAINPLHTSNGSAMWECPDFYPVSLSGKEGLDTSTLDSTDVKHVLKMSLGETKNDHYRIGRYVQEDDKFAPDHTVEDYQTWLRYDYGNFYASKTFFDASTKRRILWGWSNESDSASDDVAKGWAGIQTIPRTVWLNNSDGQLLQWPIKEIESLRRKRVHYDDIELNTGSLFQIKGVTSPQADVVVDFYLPSLERGGPFDPKWELDPQGLCSEPDASIQNGIGPFGLLVLASQNLQEHTAISFRVFKHQDKYKTLLCSDQRRSSLRSDLYKGVYGAFADTDIKDGKISLRTLVDHSVVESFGVDGRICITARVYPTLLRSSSIYAFNNGTDTVKISQLKAWSMAKAHINE